MSQKVKTLFFTFNELINIILKPILYFQSKLLLFYGKTAKDFALLAFYMDNIFEASKSYQK